MNKGEHISGLINVLKELEKDEFPEDQLDNQLSMLGYEPVKLVTAVNERINKIKQSGIMAEFDPFLLAAGKSKPVNKAKKPKK